MRLAVAFVPVLVAFGIAAETSNVVSVRAWHSSSASRLYAATAVAAATRLLVRLVLAVDNAVATLALLACLGELTKHGART